MRRPVSPAISSHVRLLLGVCFHRPLVLLAGGVERVPVATMPSWLQPIAEHNPFTTMVDAARALFLGIPAGNSVWLASVYTIAIIAVFAPLSAWRYRRVVTR